MLSNGWAVAGKYLVAALWEPSELGLPNNTRVAAYDTEAGTWAPVLQGGYFGHGLVTDGLSLYWAPQGKSVVKVPLGGGTPTTILRRVLSNPPFGGLALNANHLFLARIERGRRATIVRLDK